MRGKVGLPGDKRLREAVEEWLYDDLGSDLYEVDDLEGEFELPKDRQTAEATADVLEKIVAILRAEAPNLPEMEEKEEEEETEPDEEAAPASIPEAG